LRNQGFYKKRVFRVKFGYGNYDKIDLVCDELVNAFNGGALKELDFPQDLFGKDTLGDYIDSEHIEKALKGIS
jgi:hypothetical protein